MKKFTLIVLGVLVYLQNYSQGVIYEIANQKFTENDDFIEEFEFEVIISAANEFKLHSGQLYFNYDETVFGENLVNRGGVQAGFGNDDSEMLLAKESGNDLFKSLVTNDNTANRFSFSWQNNFSCFSSGSASLVKIPGKTLIKFRLMLREGINKDGLDPTGLVCFETGDTFDDQTFACPGNPLNQIFDDQFRCTGSKSITVLTPVLGDDKCPGDSLKISWESSEVSMVNVFLFNLADLTYSQIEENIEADKGSIHWVIPNDLTGIEGNQIIVFESGNTEVGDTSVQFSVFTNFNLTETVEVCSGENYTFPDGHVENEITESIEHQSNLKTKEGCDSIIITTVNPIGVNNDNANLIKNPSNDLPLVGGEIQFWNEQIGTNWTQRCAGPDAQEGSCYFFAGAGLEGELMQIIDVSSYADGIDNDTWNFQFSGYVRSWEQAPTDLSIIRIEQLDENGDIISQETFGPFSNTNDWKWISKTINTDIGTRSIKVVLRSERKSGTNNDGYFDNLKLHPVQIWYQDEDKDGFGNPNVSTTNACIAEREGYVLNDDDCHDQNININPDALEICDGIDNNCDGNIDESDTIVQTKEVCEGESYTFPDGHVEENIKETVAHTSNLTSEAGCDSIIVTTVNPIPVYNVEETKEVCEGESYTFPDGHVEENILETVVHVSNLTSEAGCDSIITTTVNPVPTYNVEETKEVCEGESYTFPDGHVEENILETVVHVSNLTSEAGCDSIITTTVNPVPTYNVEETKEVCEGESYTFPDGHVEENILETVVHVSNLTSEAGCDSIITTTVNPNPTYNVEETKEVCEGESYTFPDGHVEENIEETVVHTSNLTSEAGCDSIITTTVNPNPTYNVEETKEVCEGESYTFPDGHVEENIKETVVHVSNLTSEAGCDSIITTTVNPNPTYNVEETKEVCEGESYTFPDGHVEENIKETVVHVSNLTSEAGCDSIITTTVNPNPTYNVEETKEVCEGESYTFPDGHVEENIKETVVHTSNLTSEAGCDSIITTTVNPVPTYNVEETKEVCEGESYTFPDGHVEENIKETVVHTSNLTSEAGCDSIITTTVNPIPAYNVEETKEVCEGESYTFPDGHVEENIEETVVHTSNLTSETGCDSIIVTTVNPIPVYNLEETKEVCEGESYTFPDGHVEENIEETVVHTSNLTSEAGCDSIIVTTVNPIEVYNETEFVQVCKGDSYTFPDGHAVENIQDSIVHTSNLTSQSGCDSIIVTTIALFEIDTSVTVQEPKLTANATGVGYQWIDCSDSTLIPGAMEQTFIPSANGSYAVIITFGECRDTSSCHSITTIGIDGHSFGTNVSVYPNPVPVVEEFTINFGKKMNKVRVDVTSSIGKMVYSEEFENSYRLNLPLNAPGGIYFVRIISGEEAIMFKLVKE